MHEIDLRRIDLNLLVVFERLMAERSVSRAAAALSRTQSAVSHALARLREQLGDPLLVKSGSRMRASPRAEELLIEVRPILNALRRALSAPQPFDAARSTRTFSIALPDLTMTLFARLAAALLADAPRVGIDWSARNAEAAAAVAEGLLDCALVPAAAAVPEGVVGETAGQLRWATFLRRGHPAAQRLGKAAWRAFPHVAVRLGDRVPSPVQAAASAGTGTARRRIAVWVPHFSAVAPLLARTDLIATLPLIAMADTIESHDLVAVAPPFPVPPMPHRLVWNRRLEREPGLVWLREHLRRLIPEVIDASEVAVIGRTRPASAAASRVAGRPQRAGVVR